MIYCFRADISRCGFFNVLERDFTISAEVLSFGLGAGEARGSRCGSSAVCRFMGGSSPCSGVPL